MAQGSISYLVGDHLGSASLVLDSLGNTVASQLYGPYGNLRYSSGTMPTDYGFTGQRADAATSLDYYNARYYDPAVGQFASADSVLSGLNRYSYVLGNPTTLIDPSGHVEEDGEEGLYSGDGGDTAEGNDPNGGQRPSNTEGGDGMLSGGVTNASSTTEPSLSGVTIDEPNGDKDTIDGGQVQIVHKDGTVTDETVQQWEEDHPTDNFAEDHDRDLRTQDDTKTTQDDPPTTKPTSPSKPQNPSPKTTTPQECSFSADTPVATPGGEEAIGDLKVGDQVIAYDPQTGKASTQTVQHVWINHDHDLLDVTLAVDSNRQSLEMRASGQQGGPHSRQGDRSSPDDATDEADAPTADTELVHTTDNHPWLTTDRGWLPAGELRLGERVVGLDGTTAAVVELHERTGEQADYYNLTVNQLHTYAVGQGRFVVHNCGTDGNADGVPANPQDPKDVVDGQPNLYKGQAADTTKLADDGWTQTLSKDGPVKVGKFGASDFPAFLRSQGRSAAGWKYYMEQWRSPSGQVIENHYWGNPYEDEYYHHH